MVQIDKILSKGSYQYALVIYVQCLNFNYVIPCEIAFEMLTGPKGPVGSFM